MDFNLFLTVSRIRTYFLVFGMVKAHCQSQKANQNAGATLESLPLEQFTQRNGITDKKFLLSDSVNV